MQKVRPLGEKARGSNSWAEAVGRSWGDAAGPPGDVFYREQLQIRGRALERTQVQARWADPSDLPTHSNTFHKQDDHQHNQSALGWAASGLCTSTLDRDLGGRPPLELW